MLFRPKLLRLLPRYRRLMSDGIRAKAVVLRTRPWGWQVNNRVPNTKVTMKVHFDDGTTTTVDRVERTVDLGMLTSVGSIVPVRFEATDRFYLAIDVPTLQAWERERTTALEESLVRDAEQRIAAERAEACPTAPATTAASPATDSSEPVVNDVEQRAAWLLEEALRLKVDGGDEAVRAAIRARAAELPPAGDDEGRRLRVVLRILLGEHAGVPFAEEAQARRHAAHLEKMARLTLEHRRGLLSDADFAREAATLGARIETEEPG